MTSFPYHQINPYTNPIFFLYNDDFLPSYNSNSKGIQKPKNKISKTNKRRFLTRKKNIKHKKVPKTSIEQIRNQAEQGDVESMIKYGIILREGKGVKVDERESVRFFKKAAEKWFITRHGRVRANTCKK